MIMFTILQAASAANAAQGGGATMWIMLILIFVVMWFFMIRPQRKQQKEIEKMRAGLKKGDKVVTAGGIYGTVLEVQQTTVMVKIDGDVKVKVDKNCINLDTTVAAPKAEDAPKSSEK